MISLYLLEIYPCTSKKKRNLVGKFKKSRFETLIFVSMELLYEILLFISMELVWNSYMKTITNPSFSRFV